MLILLQTTLRHEKSDGVRLYALAEVELNCNPGEV